MPSGSAAAVGAVGAARWREALVKTSLPAAAEALRLQLRARLSQQKETIRTWCGKASAESGLVSFEAFQSAVASLNVRAQPQVVRTLFEKLGDGAPEGVVSVRDIQRALWSEGGGAADLSDRKAGSEALHLALSLGVALPQTQRDERAAQHMYTDENVQKLGVDRFEWEPGGGARHSAAAYRQLGDPRYETPEALERRLALLRAPSIVRACRQFWDTLQLDEGGAMHRGQYLEIHRLLTAALAPEMGESEWAEAAEEDYADDLRGHSSLNLARSIMSIFEVADLWTDSVEEWQYGGALIATDCHRWPPMATDGHRLPPVATDCPSLRLTIRWASVRRGASLALPRRVALVPGPSPRVALVRRDHAHPAPALRRPSPSPAAPAAPPSSSSSSLLHQ